MAGAHLERGPSPLAGPKKSGDRSLERPRPRNDFCSPPAEYPAPLTRHQGVTTHEGERTMKRLLITACSLLMTSGLAYASDAATSASAGSSRWSPNGHADAT